MDLPFGDEMINSARIYLPDSFLPANDSSKSSIAILSSGDENFSFAVSMDNIHIPEFSTASECSVSDRTTMPETQFHYGDALTCRDP